MACPRRASRAAAKSNLLILRHTRAGVTQLSRCAACKLKVEVNTLASSQLVFPDSGNGSIDQREAEGGGSTIVTRPGLPDDLGNSAQKDTNNKTFPKKKHVRQNMVDYGRTPSRLVRWTSLEYRSSEV